MSQMYSCASVWKGWVSLENMIYSCPCYLRAPWLVPALFELWVMLLRQNHRTPSRNTCCFKRNSMAHFKKETVLLYQFHVWCVKGSLRQNVQEHQLRFLTKTTPSFNTFRAFHFYEWRLWQNTPSPLACEEAQKCLGIYARAQPFLRENISSF